MRSGFLYLATVEGPVDEAVLGRPMKVCSPRIQPNSGLQTTERFGDLYDRVTQELRASSPESVAILATRKNNQWSYSQATDRISITSIIHLACHHLAIPCEEFKTDPVARIVGQPADKLEETPSSKYGYTKTPTYWAAGLAEAHAATAAILFSGKAVGE